MIRCLSGWRMEKIIGKHGYYDSENEMSDCCSFCGRIREECVEWYCTDRVQRADFGADREGAGRRDECDLQFSNEYGRDRKRQHRGDDRDLYNFYLYVSVACDVPAAEVFTVDAEDAAGIAGHYEKI